MDIEEILLPRGLLKEEVTVYIFQLKSPFYDEIEKTSSKGYLTLSWFPDALVKRIKKIKKLLQQVNELERHADILVMPEYCVPIEMLDDIKSFTRKNQTIFIGNCYDIESRENLSFVILPNGRTYIQPKIGRSDDDIDVLTDRSRYEDKIYRFYWYVDKKGLKKKIYFQIFTCIDFLDHGFGYTDKEHGGIIIVPMCSPKIDLFKSIGDLIMRSVSHEDGELKTIVTMLCNGTDIPNQKGVDICGGSQIIGEYAGELPVVEMGYEGGIICSVNCLNIIPKVTRIGRDNSVIKSPVMFWIDKNNDITFKPPTIILKDVPKKPAPKKVPKKLILHPYVLKLMGLNKYYLFFSVRDYYKCRTLFGKLPVNCIGIHGYHDILVQSFEEDTDFANLRVNASIRDSTLFINKKYLEVTSFIKYVGYNLAKIRPDSDRYSMETLDIRPDFIKKYRKEIKDILTGKTIDKEIMYDFINKRVFIEVHDDLERYVYRGMTEFIVFARLNELLGDVDPFMVFEEHVISRLMDDSRIRTIELCERGEVNALTHYIFSIIGDMTDVQEVIIDRIHKIASKYGVSCSTKVVIPAEAISSETYPSLIESNTNVLQRGIVKNIICGNFEESDPFIVKKIDEYNLDKVCSIYSNGNKLHSLFESKFIEQSLVHDLNKYIYGIGYIIVKGSEKILKKDRKLFKMYCTGFYVILAHEMEAFLYNLLIEKSDEMGGIDKFENKLQNILNEKSKRPYKINIKSGTTLGALIQYIVIWNSYVDDKIKIKNDDFTNKLRDLQKKRFVDFRNFFVHQLPSDFPTKDDIYKILDATNLVLKLILEEKYIIK